MMSAMKLQHEVSYAAGPARVFEMLADKIRAGIDAEHGVGVAWLEGNR
jgi:hypothetical protein